MNVPPSWAIALVVAAIAAIVALAGIAVRRGLIDVPKDPLQAASHLAAGGLAGFMAIAFPPALPVVLPIIGVLGVLAFSGDRSWLAGLLAAGWGAAWTLLLGWGVINDLADPAVAGSPGQYPALGVAVAILLGGLGLSAVTWRR
ncbi:MAG TPA: hypothetical protein VHK63_09065 [Candidatus Limnocylindria bacterium]|nr:hypothetical protein [Candidatus Limnocylindria bacterium]